MSQNELRLTRENQFLKLENERLLGEVNFANKIIIRTNDKCLLHLDNCLRYQKEANQLKELLREYMESETPEFSSHGLAVKTYHYMHLN